MKLNELSDEEKKVIIYKGTEMPFTGKYDNFFEKGIYICRQCNSPLYTSENKFDSGCGWPAFDQEILGAVKNIPDTDGIRTEVICNTCGAHLGHVFVGENLTEKNKRYSIYKRQRKLEDEICFS